MPDTIPEPNPETTELLQLPYIMSSQAQKHVTHNEALRMLDALTQIGIESRTRGAPPAEPSPGARFLVPEGADEAWGAAPGSLLAWQEGTWAALEPRAGWIAWVVDEARLIAFDGSAWRGTGAEGFATLGVNATADDTNRLAVSAPATLLTHEGDDHRLVVNKAAPGDTASLLFQSDWSGRAEMGLAGTDDWTIKVSPDGALWNEALVIDRETGTIRFPQGTNAGFLAPGVADAGGEETALGAPSLMTGSHRTSSLSPAAGRVYFCPFLVDRPTELVGAHVAQGGAAAAGSLLRVGVYALGTAAGNDWSVGPRLADLGTRPADVAGHKAFSTAPLALDPGWHLMAVGVSGAGAELRIVEWTTPGAGLLVPVGSGTDADLRASGAGVLLYANGQTAAIENGFPADWQGTAVIDTVSTYHLERMLAVPRWRRW